MLNPQSLNRYAYVLNNPINLIDPLGLSDEGLTCFWRVKVREDGTIVSEKTCFENIGFLNPDGCYDVILDGIDIGNSCDNFDFFGGKNIDVPDDWWKNSGSGNGKNKAAFEACAAKAQEKAINQAMLILMASSTLDLPIIGCLATGPLAVECVLTLELIALGTKAILVLPVVGGLRSDIAKCKKL